MNYERRKMQIIAINVIYCGLILVIVILGYAVIKQYHFIAKTRDRDRSELLGYVNSFRSQARRSESVDEFSGLLDETDTWISRKGFAYYLDTECGQRMDRKSEPFGKILYHNKNVPQQMKSFDTDELLMMIEKALTNPEDWRRLKGQLEAIETGIYLDSESRIREGINGYKEYLSGIPGYYPWYHDPAARIEDSTEGDEGRDVGD